MALDFDVDDGPSFQDLVQSGRRYVLKGRTMEQCWSELADQHAFFKDIAKEGRLRGETLGVVLAAVEGLSRVVHRTDRLTAAQAPSSAETSSVTSPSTTNVNDDLVNVEVLVRVADAYLCLYRTTPVPTRVQWLAALRPASAATIAVPEGEACDDSVPLGASPRIDTAAAAAAAAVGASPSASTSPIGRYLGKLRCTVQTLKDEFSGEGEDMDDDKIDGDDDGATEDGSFAEEELRELLRCCMTAGRRAARHTDLTKAEVRTVREMVKVLQDFVGNATLEW